MSEIVETAGAQPEIPAQETPPKPESPSLAESIREFREARTQKAQVSKEAEGLRAELEAARKELATLRGNRLDPIEDTEGWVDTLGYTPEERAYLGENLLYGLAPHKAPADWRVTVMERREARREKLSKANEEKRAAEQAHAEAEQTLKQYAQALHQRVAVTKPEDYPDSDAWFGSDEDGQRARAASLMATADNMAEAARQRGEVADLSYEKVAEELEKYLSARFARRKAPSAPPQGSTPPIQQPAPRGSIGKPAETPIAHGLTSSGGPRAQATTEEERRRRAEALLPDFSH